jgi:hypothetical protein
MTTRATSSSTVEESVGTADQQNPLAAAGREVTDDAGHLAERAANIGIERADQGRQQVAESVDRVAGSIRRVSTELQTEEPAVANAAMTAAEQGERLARYLRDTDARQLLHTVEDVARRQPILFIGGAFLIGLAASRFMRAAAVGSGASENGRGAYAIQSSGRNDWQTTSSDAASVGTTGGTGRSRSSASGSGKTGRSGRSGSTSSTGSGTSSRSRAGTGSSSGSSNSDEGAY